MAKAVYMPAAFNFVEGFAVQWLKPFIAALFNFVEGFAVQWLKPFEWLTPFDVLRTLL